MCGQTVEKIKKRKGREPLPLDEDFDHLLAAKNSFKAKNVS